MNRRVKRMETVRDWLLAEGPANMWQIMRGTGLNSVAVSLAMRDIRNDPSLEYVTVPTHGGGYVYAVAMNVGMMKAGLVDQAKHLLTRAESLIRAGEKMMALAAMPDEYALAAEMMANGRMMKMQAEGLLAALR